MTPPEPLDLEHLGPKRAQSVHSLLLSRGSAWIRRTRAARRSRRGLGRRRNLSSYVTDVSRRSAGPSFQVFSDVDAYEFSDGASLVI